MAMKLMSSSSRSDAKLDFGFLCECNGKANMRESATNSTTLQKEKKGKNRLCGHQSNWNPTHLYISAALSDNGNTDLMSLFPAPLSS
ncbi:hypothetical protein V2J09_019603 [Rumex salicifolius]